MPVTCQICFKTFEKLISSTHLKFSHNISSSEYKIKFGKHSLVSEEFRQQLSEKRSGSNNPMYGKNHKDHVKQAIGKKNSGKIPHNKGQKITNSYQLEKIKESIQLREENYKLNNNHPKKGIKLSNETKEKISVSVKNYANDNKKELKSRAQKILQTKKDRNYDFKSSMLGKEHSEKTKQIIKEKAHIIAKQRKAVSFERYSELLVTQNISLINIDNNNASLICNTCNTSFSLTTQNFTNSKFRNNICPTCRPVQYKSNAELDLLQAIKDIVGINCEVISGDRTIISPYELDIVIPTHKLAIEYNGLYWHSEKTLHDKNYHLTKLNMCLKKEYKLVQIFEDEWIHKKDIVISRLRSLLMKSQNKIFARNCEVRQVNNSIAKQFLQINHIQGAGTNKISYGLYYLNTLMSIMTFSLPSISKGAKNINSNTWELNRFCSLINYNIIGSAGKLLAKFIKDYEPEEIISYADRRWSVGNLYQQLGFIFDKYTPPNYWYIKANEVKRYHRYQYRKNKKDNQLLTEWENRQQEGMNRVWDCGNIKYKWNKKGS